MNCLKINVRGKIAIFRKPFTTTSTSTYSLMHPVAVRGFIGAIMGVSRGDLHSYTKDMCVGVQVVNNVDKTTQSFNLVGVDKGVRFPVNTEFLRDVEYNLFIVWSEDKLNKLEEILSKRCYNFTPYLGCSECVAKVSFLGKFDCTALSMGRYDVISSVPVDKIKLQLASLGGVTMEKIPVRSEASREYSEYSKVCFATKGVKLTVESDKCVKVGDDIIVLL